jgi:hypothetical protein
MSRRETIGFPPIHDHHSHVSLYAAFEGLPDLGQRDKPSALELLRGLPEDRLSLVKGWRTDRLGFTEEDLGEMPPAIIVNASLHGFAATASAAPFLESLWPELAARSSDRAWGERNLPGLFVFYGRVAGLDSAKLASFMERMEALGVGSLEDMTIGGEDALETVSSSPFAGRIACWAALEVFRGLSAAARARCAGIKVFLDGSLGARSAALDAPFSDGREGRLLYSDGELMALLSEIASYSTRLSAHAIGHRAIDQALSCLERLDEDGVELAGTRLEHAQFIDRGQAGRCKRLGVVLSMQPNFNSDSSDYADRLVPRHRAENDPFRMLIDEAGFRPGKDLIFGSDGMPHGIECALGQALFPAEEGQRLSAEELLAGYGAARDFEGGGLDYAIDYIGRTVRRVGA